MNSDVSVIIVAGGIGTRMQSDIPKQFIEINKKPIFIYSIEAVLSAFPFAQLILVLPKEHIAKAQELTSIHLPKVTIEYCEGGATRFHSSANGLKIADRPITMIHDAVRPFINKKLLENLYNACIQFGNAIPAVPVVDSIRQVFENQNTALNRSQLRAIQTPQTFKTEALKAAFAQGYEDLYTDDASVLEHYGHKIHLIEGLTQNIKITNPQDLYLATYIASQK